MDGTVSTEISITIEVDNKQILIPTVVNGAIVDDEAAIAHYEKTGEYLGKFDTISEANEYAERLHTRQEWYYSGQQKMPKLFLDWMQTYFNKDVNNQTMSVSSNVVDLSDTMEVNNIFTHVIIVGKGFNYSDGSSGGRGQKHKITVVSSRPEWGEVSASFYEAAAGQKVALSAVIVAPSSLNPSPHFDQWVVNSGGVTISGDSFEMGNSDVSITGYFTRTGGGGEHQDEHKITVKPRPQGAGRAWASKEAAASGERVALHKIAYAGHVFTRWSATGGVTINGDTLTMASSDTTVTAEFDMK